MAALFTEPQSLSRRHAGALLLAKPMSAVGLFLLVVIALAAVCAPLIAGHDPLEQSIGNRLAPPSTEFILGTDGYGRDVLSRLLHAGRLSLLIGLASIGVALVVGTLLGVAAGYFGGHVDRIVSGAIDLLLSFPSLLFGLLVVAVLGPSFANLIVAIALTEIAPFARVARAGALVTKQQAFIEAGRALGFSNTRLVLVHVIPNVLSDVFVMGTMWMAAAIRLEASLSFIGLGIQPPTPTWGGMIREGFDNLLDAPMLAMAPSVAILLTVVALNLVGDGFRDVFDPRLRSE